MPRHRAARCRHMRAERRWLRRSPRESPSYIGLHVAAVRWHVSYTTSVWACAIAQDADGCAQRSGNSPMAAMSVTGWTDTNTVAPRERIDLWRTHVTDNHGRLAFDFPKSDAF